MICTPDKSIICYLHWPLIFYFFRPPWDKSYFNWGYAKAERYDLNYAVTGVEAMSAKETTQRPQQQPHIRLPYPQEIALQVFLLMLNKVTFWLLICETWCYLFSGFTRFGSSCYFWNSKQLNWNDANEACKTLGDALK